MCYYRTDDDKCRKFTDDKYTSYCVDGPCPDDTPTNADKIRGMTDEELARNNVRKRRGYVIWSTSDGREFSSYLFGCTYRPDEETIALAIQHDLNWLRQPCGNGGDGMNRQRLEELRHQG